jgi:hypothetical protein
VAPAEKRFPRLRACPSRQPCRQHRLRFARSGDETNSWRYPPQTPRRLEETSRAPAVRIPSSAQNPGAVGPFPYCGSHHEQAHLLGAGVFWHGDPLEPPVIPAKAGIQPDDSTFAKICRVDSRCRGNDWASQMKPMSFFCLLFAFHSPIMSIIAAPVTDEAGGIISEMVRTWL